MIDPLSDPNADAWEAIGAALRRVHDGTEPADVYIELYAELTGPTDSEPECVTCIVNYPHGCHRHQPSEPGEADA